MRALRTTLIAVNCLAMPLCGAMSFGAMSFCATTVQAQSALPEFSNPHDGSAALVHADATRSSAQKSASRSPTKRIARKVSTHKIAPKQALRTSRLAAPDLEIPKTALPPPVIARDPIAPPTKSKDNGLDFGLQWSAANDPHYNTATSTIPAVSEIQRNANETPAETGSAIEAGVKLKF